MPVFGAASMKSLEKCHPSLRLIATEAIKEIDFRVLDSTRGRDAQTRAFQTGKSKAKFGQSAHNYVPAIAFDLFPAPYDWNDRKAFTTLAAVIMRIAKEKGIPLRWGGDWNMDGDKTTSDAWDMPHFELHPWRDWAKKSKLYEDG
ncbi:MAG: M15 family metallopeptidase [Agrobacterium cavarae]